MANSDAKPNFGLLDPEDLEKSSGEDQATQEMAAWMGLANPQSEANGNALPAPASALSDDGLGEEEEIESRHIDEAGKTRTPLWSNPLMKLGFVAGVAGVCLVIVGTVVTAIQSAGMRDLAPTATPREVEEPTEDPVESALREREAEIGELKTRNALGTQQLALEMQEEGDPEVSAAELLALRNQIQQRQEQEKGAANASARPEATEVPRRQALPAPPPAPRPAPRPVPRPVAPRGASSSSSPAAAPELSPQEQLAALAAAGSYGSGSALPPSEIAAAPISTGGPQTAPGNELPESAVVASAAVPSFQAAPEQADSTLAEEEAAILGHTLVTVQPGMYAQAELETPIYWAQDLANDQQSQRTALRLTEPLYGSRGEVALDAGTVLVAEVEVVSGSGLLQLHVTDVVIEAGGRQQVMSIPGQNLVIAGSEGQPLVAREIQNTDEIRAAQTQLAALGALGNVGELLNRPRSQTTSIGITNSVSTIQNGPVDILAGLLEGAADAVIPIEQSRIEGRIDDYESQPRIWYHGSDAPVMLFVAEEFTFRAD